MPMDAPHTPSVPEEMIPKDICTSDTFKDISKRLGVDHLSKADTFPPSFPATGILYGSHKRPMINLVCRRPETDAPAVNIIFFINTSAPYTYLGRNALRALLDTSNWVVLEKMPVMIHSRTPIECSLNPGPYASDVNVLGADFMVENGLSLKVNYRSKTCAVTIENEQ
ncbi:hypothetical protein HDU96_000167 [Phlyctochytrium bullatum]|nr:hypothetical protein HDU96_000167 [Phlyctochytrium bullatum]